MLAPLKALRKVTESHSHQDRDHLVPLIAEAVRAQEPVLVFCASRKQCQSCAHLAAQLLPQILGPDFQVQPPAWRLPLLAKEL